MLNKMFHICFFNWSVFATIRHTWHLERGNAAQCQWRLFSSYNP